MSLHRILDARGDNGMDNDEIKRLAREIAENSVDYTAYPRARIDPDAYPRSNVKPAPERASERPDELRTALIRWVNLEIEKNMEMTVIRQRESFILAFVCIMIKLFIIFSIVSVIVSLILILTAA